jgi:hypothetical protein
MHIILLEKYSSNKLEELIRKKMSIEKLGSISIDLIPID